jgi:hypothetical protein
MDSILTYLPMPVGAIIALIAGLIALILLLGVFPTVAFRKSWWWGVLCLVLAGPGTLAFSLTFFRETWKLLVVLLISSSLALGIFLARLFIVLYLTSQV